MLHIDYQIIPKMQIVMSQYYHLQQLLEQFENISANGAIRACSYHLYKCYIKCN